MLIIMNVSLLVGYINTLGNELPGLGHSFHQDLDTLDPIINTCKM